MESNDTVALGSAARAVSDSMDGDNSGLAIALGLKYTFSANFVKSGRVPTFLFLGSENGPM